ncbi:unnamed protein product [Lupinus luteus]|uniref:B box-type domain-containing protein n=1 Tax=Lupinus luteus TaxID=3873 RepID=A0AAV1Y2X0_LUPLU
MNSSSHVPRWLKVLLKEKFYNTCIIHEEEKKNEKKVYCLDCCISLCLHCLSPHSSHRLLQIRRYVYNDVVRLDDAAKLIDCTSVQVSHLIRTTGSLSGYLFECNYMPLFDSGFDDGHMTPNSILEPAGSGGYGGGDCRTILSCTATTEIVRRKRTNSRPPCSPVSEISVGLMNRRKGVPHRAPLY